MSCKHEWEGVSDGVRCVRCGKTLTAVEYLKQLNKKRKEEAPKRGSKKSD